VLARLSWPAAQRWGRALGAVAWHLARRDRRRALEHLEVAFPELPDSGRRRLARASFRHLGVSLAECLHLLGKGCPEILAHVEVEGWEPIEALAAAGRPLLLLTGHCGNWELLGPVASCRGKPIAAVVRALDEPALHRRLAHLRETFGSETIDRGSPGAPRKLLESLRGGRPLLMLIDQDTRVDGVWVPFFGRLAYTPVGAAKIARRQRAAVVPAFVERLPDGSHRARFQPPLELPDDPVEATAVMTARIEEQIRRRPEQWVWMHRRWRRRPPEEG
jgi:KDO2-lipid IV(A) lauroyltransferase